MPQSSVFDTLNQKLLDAGIPRWNLGSYVIEPIVTIGFLLALLIFGLPGIIFGGLLFAVSKWSQTGGEGGSSGGYQPRGGGMGGPSYSNQGGGSDGSGGSSQGHRWGNSGQKLGNS